VLRPFFDDNNVTIEAQAQDGFNPPKEDANAEVGAKSSNLVTFERRVAKRASSCPPTRACSKASGPWSLEWADRHKRAASEVKLNSTLKGPEKLTSKRPSQVLKKKGSGYLRHCAQNLKRIARLSDKDRQAVLRTMQRTMK